MAFLDSSVIIEYLDGTPAVIEAVDAEPLPHLTSSICVYEVLAGEVFSAGPVDIEQARQAFGQVDAVGFDEATAIEAARLQATLLDSGDPLSPRDLFVTATARSLGEVLLLADRDFDTAGLHRRMSIRHLDVG